MGCPPWSPIPSVVGLLRVVPAEPRSLTGILRDRILIAQLFHKPPGLLIAAGLVWLWPLTRPSIRVLVKPLSYAVRMGAPRTRCRVAARRVDLGDGSAGDGGCPGGRRTGRCRGACRSVSPAGHEP